VGGAELRAKAKSGVREEGSAGRVIRRKGRWGVGDSTLVCEPAGPSAEESSSPSRSWLEVGDDGRTPPVSEGKGGRAEKEKRVGVGPPEEEKREEKGSGPVGKKEEKEEARAGSPGWEGKMKKRREKSKR